MAAMQYSYQSETDTSQDQDGSGPFVHAFCPSPGAPIPATVPSVPVLVPSATWTSPPWECLRLQIKEPLAFQLDLATSGTGSAARYAASATFRRNDGTHSTLLLQGRGTTTGDAEVTSLTLDGNSEDCTSAPCEALCVKHDSCRVDQVCATLSCSNVPDHTRVDTVTAKLASLFEKKFGGDALTESGRLGVWRNLALDSIEHPQRWECEAACAETESDLADFHGCASPCNKLP
ncbi:MAG: hypothetical protein JNL79_33175 [Myxococcales bacterium]|nr:hypothetical protein [Myxococcales bacterium]